MIEKVATVEPLLQLQLLEAGLKFTAAGPVAFQVYVKLPLPPGQLALLPFLVAVRLKVPPVTTVVLFAAGGSIVTCGVCAETLLDKIVASKGMRIGITFLLRVKVFMLKIFMKK